MQRVYAVSVRSFRLRRVSASGVALEVTSEPAPQLHARYRCERNRSRCRFGRSSCPGACFPLSPPTAHSSPRSGLMRTPRPKSSRCTGSPAPAHADAARAIYSQRPHLRCPLPRQRFWNESRPAVNKCAPRAASSAGACSDHVRKSSPAARRLNEAGGGNVDFWVVLLIAFEQRCVDSVDLAGLEGRALARPS
jgi:hypothetical protein